MRPARLPVALRAFTEPPTKRPSGVLPRPSPEAWPKHVLVLDTETTTDPTQHLLFGWYRFCEWRGDRLTVLEEGIICGDELPEMDRTAYSTLLTYARTHKAEGKDRLIQVRSRSEFIEDVLMNTAYRLGGMVVGFNLPFDLSRLALKAGQARGSDRRGFSFLLSRYKDKKTGSWQENPYRPRLNIEHVNSKRARVALTRPAQVEPDTPMAKDKTFSGRFLDLRTLAFGLSGKGHTLASACEAFGVTQGKATTDEHGQVTEAYVDYARQDVRATAELLVKLREEFDRHPIDLAPDRVASPASIAKAYLEAMGLGQPLDTFRSFPRERIGHAMTAYYGGRAEVRIRRTEMPVVYLDFLSMYPTVNSLMGLWRYLTAADVQCVDATEDVRALLERIDVDDLGNPETWQQLPAFALLDPDGDIVPVRAEYGADGSQNIGVNPLMAGGGPQWYALPDLIASKLLNNGRAPRIIEAFKLVPVGQSDTLRNVRLRGVIPVDPRSDDFFRRVIEERKRVPERAELPAEEKERSNLFLKVLANSGTYGIYAEMNAKKLRTGQAKDVNVYGLGEVFTEATPHPETPGRYCFPPIAALITSAARLMLALLEHQVASRGGAYVLCDTDSMAIVATETGGLVPCLHGLECTEDGAPAVRALSWSEVGEIVEWFSQLNPYDREAVPGSVLKIEDENFNKDTGEREQAYAFAISAKRYVLYNRRAGTVEIRKASEHGLGHLMNPLRPESDEADWIDSIWRRLIEESAGADPGEPPAWFAYPALVRTAVSSPELLRPFQTFNKGKPYAEQVKPFNFLLSAVVAPLGHPVWADPKQFHLVARYERDPERWARLPWFDRYSGRRVPISTDVARGAENPAAATVRTYGDVCEEYATHPEPKSADADGKSCSRSTVGLLARRPVVPLLRSYIGKESNRLEDVHSGLMHDWSEVRNTYSDDHDMLPENIRELLKGLPAAELAERLGISEGYITALRNGHMRPSTELLEEILWMLR